MTQLSLTEWRPPQAAPGSSEQTQHLVRVERGLAKPILEWCREHQGQDFHLATITEAVLGHVTAAPDSVRRILAQLRRAGHVDVVLLDRRRSLYRLGRVRA